MWPTVVAFEYRNTKRMQNLSSITKLGLSVEVVIHTGPILSTLYTGKSAAS